ncbi:hypothetical protein H696_03832 [Fonticula alba]|nr:hypothetical protein H696_03832 [Fonticula alba]KCV69401.1 hypothetical protein H696_03832 [Fonticula alba]|eukprot:XP_009495966.1 hypothetical protein H696_03832 [Fonticula alba]
MSPEDRENFNFDAATIDWPTYIFNYYLGTERFIPASLPGNPARNRVLSWLLVASFYTVQFFAAVFLFYYVFGERIQNQLFGEDSILSPLEQPAIIELEDDFAGGMAAGGSPIAGDL